MAGASLQLGEDGRGVIEGVLDFASVPALWSALRPAILDGSLSELSLAGVSAGNSAALALLVEAVQAAEGAGHALRLRDIPAGLADLARLSNAEGLLGLEAPEEAAA